jgi:hypothetical protein
MLHYCEHKSRDKQSHICCYNCDEVDFDFRAFFAKTLLFTSIAGFCVYFLMC